MAKAEMIPLIEDFDNIPAEALVPEEEWPYSIPKHWKWVRLGSVVKNVTDKTESFGADDKYLGLEDLHTGGGILRISDTHEIKSAKTVFQYGDVLYGKLRPYLNKHAVANFSGVCSTDILALRPVAVNDAAYLNLWISTPIFLNRAIADSKGVNLPRISFKCIAQYPFPLPPIEEQREIVAHLDEKLGKIDSVCDKLQEFLDQSDMRKDNLIQAGVTGHLTSHWRAEHKAEISEDIKLAEDSLVPEGEWPYPIPPHWKWVRLGRVTEVVSGGTPKTTVPEYWENGEICWLTPSDLSGYSERYISRGSKTITLKGLDHSSATLFPKGTVCLTTRAPIGYVVIAADEMSTNQGFKSFVPGSLVVSEYLAIYLKGSKPLLESMASGTTFLELSKSKAGLIPFPLPPVVEQKEIVALLENYLEKESAAKRLVLSAQNQLDLMRQQLVSAALAGRLTTVLK